MNLSGILKSLNPVKSIRKLLEPRLDPARPARIFRKFDEGRGYRAYHAQCKERLERSVPDEAAQPLREAGFQFIEVMNPAAAAKLLEHATAGASVTQLKYDTDNLEGYRIRDPALARELLEAALPPEVDSLLAGFFRSEYLVHWFTLSRTAPASVQKSISFRWHCDKGPTAHLKLLVYLNDSREHGGGTAFLNLADTALLAEKGYVFGSGHARTGDPEELARIAGREILPCFREVRAGQGVVFQPSRTLHSGVTPRLGPRYVLTLCLLPSPVHWRDALQRGTLSDLMEDRLWHSHAAELLRCLDQGTGLPRA
jgi:hypothetical protein